MIATHPKGNVLYSPFSDDYASSRILCYSLDLHSVYAPERYHTIFSPTKVHIAQNMLLCIRINVRCTLLLQARSSSAITERIKVWWTMSHCTTLCGPIKLQYSVIWTLENSDRESGHSLYYHRSCKSTLAALWLHFGCTLRGRAHFATDTSSEIQWYHPANRIPVEHNLYM